MSEAKPGTINIKVRTMRGEEVSSTLRPFLMRPCAPHIARTDYASCRMMHIHRGYYLPAVLPDPQSTSGRAATQQHTGIGLLDWIGDPVCSAWRSITRTRHAMKLPA